MLQYISGIVLNSYPLNMFLFWLFLWFPNKNYFRKNDSKENFEF